MLSLIGLLVASCTKSHTCTCTTQVAGVPDVTQQITIDGTNGNASKTCAGFGVVSPSDSASTTCVLQ